MCYINKCPKWLAIGRWCLFTKHLKYRKLSIHQLQEKKDKREDE